MSRPRKGTFRSLRVRNYRVWASGAIVSNIGTWMQRTAQDWLVLTQLTHRNATAVGIVTALQFAPQLLLLPVTGFAADHFERRKLIFATQAAMGTLALGLGLLTVLHLVALWHVYVFAFLLGCAAAFDAPVRQTFVAELVGEAELSNAVGLNSTSFNAARMLGPAIGGLLIAAVGTGWVFLLNAASFVAVLVSLSLLRPSELHVKPKEPRKPGDLADGFRYAWRHEELRVILAMIFLVGTFGLHFPIFISAMAVNVFHVGARHYGLLTSAMAVGSITGSLLAARREKPNIALLFFGAAAFGAGFSVAALMPTYWLFGVALAFIGVSAQTLTTTALSTAQLATEPAMRGRVIAIVLAVALGATPVGAPIVGFIADRFGPRWSLGMGAFAGFSAALVGARYLLRRKASNAPAA